MPSEAGFGADGGRDVGGAQYKKVPMRSDLKPATWLLSVEEKKKKKIARDKGPC